MNGERIDDYVEEINNNENADTKTKLDIEGTKTYYTGVESTETGFTEGTAEQRVSLTGSGFSEREFAFAETPSG